MTKRKCSAYVEAHDLSSGTTMWTQSQQEMYDRVYKKRKVFSHRYVKWSDSTDLAKDVATKYESLGVKNLVGHNNDTWPWNEDIIRRFYSTLEIKPDLTDISFMVGTTRHVVTKKQFEEVLGIKSMTGSIVLHELTKKGKEAACSKKVRNLQTQLDLIQKINRWTLLPRESNRGACSDVSIRLANAILKGEHFDIASFIFTEMNSAIGNKNQLPYGSHICFLLLELEYIAKESIGNMFSPKEYCPKVMKKPVTCQSIEACNVRLLKQVESLQASNAELRNQVESTEDSNIQLREQVKSLEASNVGLAKQVKSLAVTVDKLTRQENVGVKIVGKPLKNVVVQSEKSVENVDMQLEKPLYTYYKRRGGSRDPAGA